MGGRRIPEGTVVQVPVQVGRKTVYCPCMVESDERGQHWVIDYEPLVRAMEDAAELEAAEMEASHVVG